MGKSLENAGFSLIQEINVSCFMNSCNKRKTIIIQEILQVKINHKFRWFAHKQTCSPQIPHVFPSDPIHVQNNMWLGNLIRCSLACAQVDRVRFWEGFGAMATVSRNSRIQYLSIIFHHRVFFPGLSCFFEYGSRKRLSGLLVEVHVHV